MTLPKVSIIFSARNEAPQVRTALESMLHQDYPDYEVIAVNDRSEDETSFILKSFSSLRLKVLDIRTLPKGWLGKTNALYQGYRAASGSWLLFTDGDVHFAPAALRTAMQMILKKELDHLVVFPKMICRKWSEIIFTSTFIMAFFRRFRPWAAQNPKSKSFIGVGAFNLVRREIYQKAGTHEKIAFDVLDDLHLGKIIKAAGGRQMAAAGPDLVSVQWVKDWNGVLKSLEKNSFAGFDYQLWRVVLGTFAAILLDIFPFLAVLFFSHQPFFIFIFLTLVCIAAAYAAGQKVNPYSAASFLTHPFGAGLLFYVLWRSVLKILKDGGVTWRDTFYSLNDLKTQPGSAP